MVKVYIVYCESTAENVIAFSDRDDAVNYIDAIDSKEISDDLFIDEVEMDPHRQ